MDAEQMKEAEPELEPLETRDQVVKRFPSIEAINDDDLREQVIDVLYMHTPDYFWTKPATSTGKYHQKDHRGKHGLYLHTCRAAVVFNDLARAEMALGRINEYEADCGRAAILMHDLFKYGGPPAAKHTHKKHDKIAADYLEENTGLPEEVIRCVLTHNGGWGCKEDPETVLEHIHFKADYFASRKANDNLGVYKPHPVLKEKLDPLVIDEI